MAQQVEHVLGKDEVTGSNPVISSTNTADLFCGVFCFHMLLYLRIRSVAFATSLLG